MSHADTPSPPSKMGVTQLSEKCPAFYADYGSNTPITTMYTEINQSRLHPQTNISKWSEIILPSKSVSPMCLLIFRPSNLLIYWFFLQISHLPFLSTGIKTLGINASWWQKQRWQDCMCSEHVQPTACGSSFSDPQTHATVFNLLIS
jgi:hypothetical protein